MATRKWGSSILVLAGAVAAMLLPDGDARASSERFTGAFSIDGSRVDLQASTPAEIDRRDAGPASARGTEILVFEEGFESGFPSANWELFWNTDQSSCLSPYRWDVDQTEVFEGSFSAWCAGKSEKTSCRPDVTPAEGYPTNMISVMVYGPLDLTGANEGRLDLRYWIDSEIATDPQFDSVFWGVNDQWLQGETIFYGEGLRGNSLGWASGTLDLTSVPTLGNVLGQNDVYLAIFFFSNANDTNEPGAFVDNIRVTKQVPTPVCSIESTPVEFGEVRVGETRDLTFTITNAGTGTLTGMLTESTSPQCDQFSLVTDPSYSLGASASKQFTVRFAPTSGGPKSCILTPGTGCTAISLAGTGRANQAPTIDHKTVTTAAAGAGLTISAEIDDADAEDTVTSTLFYRRGGSTNYTQLSMSGTEPAPRTAVIPAASVTTRGLQYYIHVTDGTEDVFVPTGFETSANPLDVAVEFDTRTNPNVQPAGTIQTAYRMISVPLVIDQRGTLEVLRDDFGDYNRLEWRFFRFEDGDFEEFSAAPAANFDRGKAYWLITRDGGPIDVGTGRSSPLAPVDVVLEPGWNDIAVPFEFPIEWEDLQLTGAPESEIDGPYGFDGSWVSPSNITRLQPWRGYSVFYSGNGAPTLRFPVTAADAALREASTSGAPAPTPGAAESSNPVLARADGPIDDENWRVFVSAQADEALDWDNAVGWSAAAEDGTDRFDHREPRAIGGFVSLATEREGSFWTHDVRAPKPSGDVWRIRVESNVDAPVRLRADLAQIPGRFEARLWDSLTGQAYDLRAHPEIELAGLAGTVTTGDTRGHVRALELIVGTADFVASGLQEITRPVAYQVFAPAPNPSGGSTAIRYQMPEAGPLELAIYDGAGRRVAVLTSGWEAAGDRRIVWDGRDDLGRRVPAGTYFVRMSSGDYEGRQKLLIVR